MEEEVLFNKLQQQPPPSAPLLEFNGTMAKMVVLAQVFQGNFTGAEFLENGTAIYSFYHPQIGNFIVTGATPATEEAGFRFENQTMYAPDGREIKVVPD
jgi:hypothetical protein